MEYDSIPFDRMRPDASLYQKGMRLIVNAVPSDGGGWRELGAATVVATVSASGVDAGCFSDPAGAIWIGTSNTGGPSSRLYEFDPVGGTFTNRTPGTDYGGAPSRWSFTKFGASVIAAPTHGTGSAIVLQVRSGSGNFANLVTSADRPEPKYVGASRSHVIGLNNQGGAGLYNTADPYQFMWCARNNAAVWSPGTDRAGFGRVNDTQGRITGGAFFKDFFLIFQEFGVTRASWIGGDAVWELQEIGGAADGLRGDIEASAAVVTDGRDAFYLAVAGLRVVRNGEVVEEFGEGSQRLLRDSIGISGEDWRLVAAPIQGAIAPVSGLMAWSYSRTDNTRVLLTYHKATDRVSVWEPTVVPSQGATTIGAALTQRPGHPAEEFVLFVIFLGTLSAVRFKPAVRASMPLRLYTSRWRPQTGIRASLHSCRPLLVTSGSYSTITVQVNAAQEPRFAGVNPLTATTASLDDNGWLTSDIFPTEGAEFNFKLSIPDLGTSTIIDMPAIELAFASKGQF